MRTWLEGIELDPVRVIATPEVTHIRYKVNGRQPLVLDNRGREEEPVPGSSKSSLGVSGGTGSG
jgi:hypothetical protein